MVVLLPLLQIKFSIPAPAGAKSYLHPAEKLVKITIFYSRRPVKMNLQPVVTEKSLHRWSSVYCIGNNVTTIDKYGSTL